MKSTASRFLVSALALSLVASALADIHPNNVPALNSRAGAAYTVYLDFAGFNYTGTWSGQTVGNVPAFDGVTSSFGSTDISRIKEVWSRISEKYAAFNVNVTTVDPAVAAGKSSTDFARQAYYDSTAKLMHTVFGGSDAWLHESAGGVSFLGTTQNSYSTSQNGGAGAGNHTNWIFTQGYESQTTFMGEAGAHENGHGLGLWHQSDYKNGSLTEYSENGGATGNGSYAPTMGDSYYSQRGTWRDGVSHVGNSVSTQNDVATILSNSGLTLVDDGIGHTLSTATALSLTGTNINFANAKGVIMPVTTAWAGPVPVGVDSYTKDLYSFHTTGNSLSLTLHDGAENLVAGQADPGATIESKLVILDASGNVVAQGIEASDTLSESWSGALAAGDYYAEVLSLGGYASTFDSSANYYTMGSYFLTGSGFSPVPEPGTFLALGAGLLIFARKRRK